MNGWETMRNRSERNEFFKQCNSLERRGLVRILVRIERQEKLGKLLPKVARSKKSLSRCNYKVKRISTLKWFYLETLWYSNTTVKMDEFHKIHYRYLGNKSIKAFSIKALCSARTPVRNFSPMLCKSLSNPHLMTIFSVKDFYI